MRKQSVTVVESLEPRRMMSGTPKPTVNFVGQYEIFSGGALHDVDIRRVGTSLTSYSGDIVTNGADTKFTATEATSNVLSGMIAASGGSLAFTATLSGKTLTVIYTKSKTQVVLTQVSTTPGAPPPALTKYTGSLFSYVKPASWTETQTASGIKIQSPDGTQQVGAIGSVADGAFNLSSIAASEQKAGATILFDKVLQTHNTLTTQFESGVALITFMRNGVLYASAQEVETYIFSNKGIYNPKTKTYSGVTLTQIYEASAPKSVWVSDNATMIYMMTSIKSNSSLTSPGGAPAGSKPIAFSNPGLFDPGTIGAWSVDGLFNAYYKSSYYDIAEGNLLNYETLAQEAAIQSSVNSFCNYLTS